VDAGWAGGEGNDLKDGGGGGGGGGVWDMSECKTWWGVLLEKSEWDWFCLTRGGMFRGKHLLELNDRQGGRVEKRIAIDTRKGGAEPGDCD